MSKSALLRLADDIAADRRITADEALQLRGEIFPDGVVTRQEADVLVSLHGMVVEHDDAWAQMFAEAVCDHALQASMIPGHVEEETVEWLIARLDGQGVVGMHAALKIAERAESVPDALMTFVRLLVTEHIGAGPIDAANVEYVRRALYASGGAGGVAVEAPELDWLFMLDAATDGQANDPAWQDLFVKAGMCHVVGRRAPALLEPEAMRAMEQRFGARARMTPLSMLQGLMGGGFGRFKRDIQEPGDVGAVEQHYAAINFETDDDARLTADEAASLIGLSDRDGKRTANEEALLAALRALEAEQG
jgi:hypothetical protein